MDKPKYPDEALQRPVSYPMMLFAICLGAFLSHLTAGLLNIALPDISLQFHRPLSATQWIITGYLLSITACLPLMGKLADGWGKRKIHNTGYLIFAIGSLFAALSPNLWMLLVFRVLQGVGAAMYQATNIAIITAVYPKEHRGRALGMTSTAVAAGSLLGPALGGLIIQWLPWNALFWLLAPLAAIAYGLAQRYVPMDEPGRAGRLDVVGALFFTFTMTALVAGLNTGSESGWFSQTTFVLLLASFLGAVVFYVWTARAREPFMNMEMFAHPMIRLGVLISLVSFTAAFSTQVVLPFYLRGIVELSPALTGLLMLSYPLLLAVMGPISGGLSDRFGSFIISLSGLILMFLSLLGLSALDGASSLVYISLCIAILGLSMGMITSPNYNLVMSHAPKRFLGMMSSVIALCRNLGMVLGTTLGLALMNLWIPGTVADWMAQKGTVEAGLVQAVLGFKTVFWTTAALVLLTAAYFGSRQRKTRLSGKVQKYDKV